MLSLCLYTAMLLRLTFSPAGEPHSFLNPHCVTMHPYLLIPPHTLSTCITNTRSYIIPKCVVCCAHSSCGPSPLLIEVFKYSMLFLLFVPSVFITILQLSGHTSVATNYLQLLCCVSTVENSHVLSWAVGFNRFVLWVKLDERCARWSVMWCHHVLLRGHVTWSKI